MTISKTAHGKVIMIGEHSVVYGHQALVYPVLSATVTIKATRSTINQLESPFYEGQFEHAPSFLAPFLKLVEEVLFALKLNQVHLQLQGNLPIAAGMGFSAAVARATVEALYELAQVKLDPHTLKSWIHQGETYAHGRPSGIDMEAILHDTPRLFENGSSSPFIGLNKGFLLITYSNIKGQTKDAVAYIQMLSDDIKHPHLTALQKLTDQLIEAQEMHQIGHILNEAHTHLKHLGVSNDTLDLMVQTAHDHGALGAKLTGGGLGGCMISYFDNMASLKSLQDTFKKQGFQTQFILNFEAFK